MHHDVIEPHYYDSVMDIAFWRVDTAPSHKARGEDSVNRLTLVHVNKFGDNVKVSRARKSLLVSCMIFHQTITTIFFVPIFNRGMRNLQNSFHYVSSVLKKIQRKTK